MDNYYRILGVKDFASLDEIKIAYRKLSKKFHPDVNEGDTFFEERFKEIQYAYEVLDDSDKKIKYDAELRSYYREDVNFKFNESDKKQTEEIIRTNISDTSKINKLFEERKKRRIVVPFLMGLVIALVIILLFIVKNRDYKSSGDAYSNASTLPQNANPNASSPYSNNDYSSSGNNTSSFKTDNFTLGSSKKEVLKVQGNPTSIHKYEFSGEEVWYYGTSSITFKKEKVSEYSNSSENLNVTVNLSDKNSKKETNDLSSLEVAASSKVKTSTKKHKSNTKWIYFSCSLLDFDHTTNYYSKIYEVNTERKTLKIKNCLIEQLKFFTHTESFFLLEHTYDSYSDASAFWGLESGKKIFGDGTCDLE
jgi:curved DNA-binding protein CbpA